jgi:SAM-dependent methyltransferase
VDNNTVYEWILHSTFTVSAREQSLQSAKPHLSALVDPGDDILDLCCGSGFISFWFEKQRANVIAIDFAPYMIALAKEEASYRNSSVEFLEADIFTQDFGQQCFDLISCFGNSISDFPLSDFAKLGNQISSALKPSGRFVLDYHDGSYEFMQGRAAREGVYQEAPERIIFRYKDYLPEIGAYVHTIRNEARGEEYERKGYIYTVPTVHLALSNVLELDQHIILDENHFMDVFSKRND